MANNTGKKFWADASKKTATWTGVAAIAVVAAEQAEEWLGGPDATIEGHHWIAVIAAAVLRAVLSLWQGNVGDRTKASFAPAADDGDTATDEDGDGPDGG